MFDPGGSTDRLRACPFLEAWRAFLYGWTRLDAVMVVTKAGALLVHGGV